MYVCMYYVFMCVCVYVGMYVCMYVRTYVRMFVCMYICMYVCMYVRIYVCMYAYIHACMYACMYIRMYVCMQVFMYVRKHRHKVQEAILCEPLTPHFYSPLLHIMGKETVALHADGKHITFMSVTTTTHVKCTKSVHCVLNL